jgi:hypothetical protein
MSPEDLNQVVDNYLADLNKIGVRLVLAQTQVGDSNDQVTADDRVPFKETGSQRQPDTLEAEEFTTAKS